MTCFFVNWKIKKRRKPYGDCLSFVKLIKENLKALLQGWFCLEDGQIKANFLWLKAIYRWLQILITYRLMENARLKKNIEKTWFHIFYHLSLESYFLWNASVINQKLSIDQVVINRLEKLVWMRPWRCDL